MSTLAIQIISAINAFPKDPDRGCNSFCIVKYFGNELFRTEICEATTDPVWQHAETKPISVFKGKEKEYNRSCFLERLDVEVYNVDRSNKAELIGATKIHLFNIGAPGWYALVNTHHPSREIRCRLLVGLTLMEGDKSTEGRILNFLKLSEVLPPINNRHLYFNFDWDAHASIGSPMLPVFEASEVVMDKRDNVDWDLALGSNSFGDRHLVSCRGSLILTDIRVLFLPTEVFYPTWMDMSFGRGEYSENQRLLIRRLTYIMPISCLQDVKLSSGPDANSASISLFGKDGSAIEFFIRKRNSSHAASYHLYRAGLMTDEVQPLIWCQRVTEELNWLIKEGHTWIRFAKYLRRECELKLWSFSKTCMSIDDATKMVNVGADYRRLRASEDWQWEPSSLNAGYKLCSTYPQLLYFPKVLSDEDISRAAKVRSRNRLIALSWIHPVTGVALTRAAQPKTGLGTNTEDDRRALLAVATASPSSIGRPLRIIDARPYMNAQANALRGKGFENVGSLGGPSVAALAFMDIHNIHVMRESLLRLREETSVSNLAASSVHSNVSGLSGLASTSSGHTVSGLSSTSHNASHTEKIFGPGGSVGDRVDGLQSSKWLHHISTVLRAAVTTADSVLQNNPVLVHCSDGWDRTAQLTGLTAIMLDPFYRTIEGLFVVIEKEFVSFGHQFEHRCGKTTDKETSPVFLQFLDCIYQLIQQFPTKFEYSSKMISLLAQLCYSGMFISFNKNCERETMKSLSVACADEKLSREDLPYTSVYTYIRVLLYSSIGEGLINPYYFGAATPSSEHALVDYIRPKYCVSDMLLWEDGVMPPLRTGLSKFHSRTPTQEECSMFLLGTNSRYLYYLQTHVQELPPSVIQILERIHGSHCETICPTTPYRRNHQLSRHDYRNFNNLSDQGIAPMMSLLLESNGAIDGSIRESLETVAAIRIQLWFRATIFVSRFYIMKGEYVYLGPQELVDIEAAQLEDVLIKPNIAVKSILKIFLTSELKFLSKRRRNSAQVTQKLVHDIILETVDMAVQSHIRNHTISDARDSLVDRGRTSTEEGTDKDGRSIQRNTFGVLSMVGRFLGNGKKSDLSSDEGSDNSESEDDDDDDFGVTVLAAISSNNKEPQAAALNDSGSSSWRSMFSRATR